MGVDGGAGGLVELLVHVGVQIDHDGGDVAGAVGECVQDLALAHPPVFDERRHVRDGIGDRRSVGRSVGRLGPVQEKTQAGQVVVQVAVRRRDHRGRPAHDVVSGEQRGLLPEGKAEVVGDVARRVERLDGEARRGYDVAVGGNHVRDEVPIA